MPSVKLGPRYNRSKSFKGMYSSADIILRYNRSTHCSCRCQLQTVDIENSPEVQSKLSNYVQQRSCSRYWLQHVAMSRQKYQRHRSAKLSVVFEAKLRADQRKQIRGPTVEVSKVMYPISEAYSNCPRTYQSISLSTTVILYL